MVGTVGTVRQWWGRWWWGQWCWDSGNVVDTAGQWRVQWYWGQWRGRRWDNGTEVQWGHWWG
eukprot:7899565-Pyramimonas_sp.AAC.1